MDRLARLVLLSSCLFLLLVAPSSAAGRFLVPVGEAKGGFGSFHETPSNSAHHMRQLFGTPSSVFEDIDDFGSCRLVWRDLGIDAQFASFGSNPPDACDNGFFRNAVLTDPRWHTGSGVHPGGPRRAARRAAVRHCGAHAIGCLASGFVLGLHRSQCAAGRFPTVIAHTRGHRVVSLVVSSHVCE